MSWKQVRLGDVALKIRNGLSPSNQGKITFNVLTLTAITGSCFNATAFKAGMFNDIPKDKLVFADDFLVCRGNGNINLVGTGRCPTSDMPNTLFPDTIIGVRIDNSIVYKKYLEHVWCHSFVRSQINKKARTTNGTFKINQAALESILIPLPTLPEQKRIAAILDKADAIRRKRKETLELADKLLKSVFLEMFGDPVTNPKGWKEARLSTIADIASGVTKGKCYNGKELVQVPYMRVANVQDGNIDLSEIKEITISRDEMTRYALNDGDVLLTEGGDPDKLGRGAVWHGQISPCIHQNHIFRVRVDRGVAYPEYLSLLIGSQRGKRYFLKAAKQTTGIASINMTQLKSFSVLLPPLDDQSKFMDAQKLFIKKRKQLVASFTYAGNLFSSLVTRAFNGEL